MRVADTMADLIVCATCLHTKNFLLSFGFDAIIGMISMEVA